MITCAHFVFALNQRWQHAEESLWPGLDDVLPSDIPESDRKPLFMALVRLDIEWRLEKDEDFRGVDDYLSHPVLGPLLDGDLQAVRNLIREEYQFRRALMQLNTPATYRDFLRRYSRFDENTLRNLCPSPGLTCLCPKCDRFIDFMPNEAHPYCFAHQGTVTRLDHYLVDESATIGKGGFGNIFRGVDIAHKGVVAIKRLKNPASINPRFIEEAKTLADLRHPGIVPIHHFGSDQTFFAMKLIDGTDLSEWLPKHLDDFAAKERIFEAICRVMAFVHAQGRIHRDLKPQNVMIEHATDHVYVLDWGFGKSLASFDKELSKKLDIPTNTGIIGTPSYMAPEQAQGSARTNPINERTDVFNLGGILCELLTNKPPYVPERDSDRIDDGFRRRIITGDMSETRQRLQQCKADKALRDLALLCLEPKPSDRPPDASDVLRRFKEFVVARSRAIRDAENNKAKEAERKRATRLGRLLIGVAIAGVAVAVLAAALGYFNRQIHIAYGAVTDSNSKLTVATAEAELQRDRADNESQAANNLRQEADKLRRRAEALEVRSRERAEDTLDASLLNNARREWLTGKGGQAISTLNQARWSRRGWEHELIANCLKGDAQLRLRGHTSAVTGLCAIPRSSQIATASFDKTIRLWDLSTGTQIKCLSDGETPMTDVVADDTGRFIVAGGGTGNGTGKILIWDLKAGTVAHSIVTPSCICALAFSPASNTFATARLPLPAGGAQQFEIVIWDLSADPRECRLVCKGRVPTQPTSLQFSPDGKTLYASGGIKDRDSCVFRIDALNGKRLSAIAEQTDAITSARCTPDGLYLITACRDKTIRGWNIQQERLAFQLPCDRHSRLALSPDGKLLGICSSNDDDPTGPPGSVQFVDLDSKATTSVLRGHVAPILCAAFTADGSKMITGSWDDTVEAWNARTPFKASSATPRQAAMSGNGSVAALTNDNGALRVIDVATGSEKWRFNDHGGLVAGLAVSGDGKFVATGCWDNLIRLFDAQSGKTVKTFRTPPEEELQCVAFSPDGMTLAWGSGGFDAGRNPLSGKVRAINLTNGEVRLVRAIPQHSVQCIGFANTSSSMAVGCIRFDGRLLELKDGKVIVLDYRTGEVIAEVGTSRVPIRCVAYSPNDALMAMGGSFGFGGVFDTATREKRFDVITPGALSRMMFTSDSSRLLSLSDDGSLRVWDTKSGNERLSMNGSEERDITDFGLSANDSVLVLSHNDGQLEFMQATATRQPLVKKMSGRVKCAAFAPSGEIIASGGAGLSVVDPETGSVSLFAESSNVLSCVVFSHDGKILVGCGAARLKAAKAKGLGGGCEIWNVGDKRGLFSFKSDSISNAAVFSPVGTQIAVSDATGVSIHSLNQGAPLRIKSPAKVFSVAYSGDGSHIIGACSDGTCRVWDMTTLVEARSLARVPQQVVVLKTMPNGQHVVGGGENGLLVIWDEKTGTLVSSLEGHTRIVTSLCVSPDGRQLISGSYDGTIRIWDMATGKETKRLFCPLPMGEIDSIAIDPRSGRLCASIRDGRIAVWRNWQD